MLHWPHLILTSDEEMLILIMNDLDQLVPPPPQPEERGVILQAGESLVELGDGVVTEGDVGADTVGPEVSPDEDQTDWLEENLLQSVPKKGG